MNQRADLVMPPPYVSFSTFRTLREWLGDEGVPLRFDRSFWESKFSGSTGTQLVAALRFLGLLDREQPQQGMERMAEATTAEWRFLLAELLHDSYTAVPFDELPRATPAMVRGWFRAYPVDGHTLRKAISFFVSAAKEADLPMSNGVRKMAKGRPARQPAPPPADRVEGRRVQTASAEPRPAATRVAPGGSANQTVVNLESGGTVTLSVAVDLFQLSERDRRFVLGLIDLTKGYTGDEAQEAKVGG
jgi:hypothetical protein